MPFEEEAAPRASATFSRTLGVVSADQQWRHLHTSLGDVANLARSVFLHPSASVLFLDHWKLQMALVAQLRAGRLSEQAPPLKELCSVNDAFATLCSGRPFRFRPQMVSRLNHPDLETVTLHRSVAQGPDGQWHESLEPADERTAQLLGLLDLL